MQTFPEPVRFACHGRTKKETVGGAGNGERNTRKAPRQRNGMAGGGRLARETTESFIRKDYKYSQQGGAPSHHKTIPVNTNIQSVRKRGERNTGVASDAPFPPTSKTRHRNKTAGWSATHRVCNVLGIKRLHDQILLSGRVRRQEAGKTLRDGPATKCVMHQSRLGIRVETLRNRYKKDAPCDQRLQTAELEWILNNMRRSEYQAAWRIESVFRSTSFLINPIGGINGVSHAMIKTTYRHSQTNINTSKNTSKGGRLLGFLLRDFLVRMHQSIKVSRHLGLNVSLHRETQACRAHSSRYRRILDRRYQSILV